MRQQQSKLQREEGELDKVCGILGISRSNRSKLTDDQVKIILSILISRMDDRGGDSFGYYTNGSIVKGVGTGAYSMDLDRVKSAKTFFAHTRKATVGDITKENAHPWRINNIVGCHNGSVSNHQDLNRKYNRKYDVDSQHIFAHYSQDLPLSELRAHGAIVFVDELFNKDVMFAGRFNDGLLTIVGIGPKDGEAEDIVFCSLGPAIKSALDMAKVPDYRSYGIEAGQLYQVYDGKLLYNIPNTKLAFSSRTNLNLRREYDLSCTDWNFRPISKKEEEKAPTVREFNPKILNYPPAPKKSELTQPAIAGFVRKRTGLEAWYGAGNCYHCEIEKATVRVPCTDLLYCHECWTHFEKISPFMLLKDEHEFFFVPEAHRPERVMDDEEEEVKLCDRCQNMNAAWFVPKQDMSLCNPCRVESGYMMKEIIGIKEKGNALEVVASGQEYDSSAYPNAPEGAACWMECGRPGTCWYRDDEAEKYIWTCTPCFMREFQSREQKIFNELTGGEEDSGIAEGRYEAWKRKKEQAELRPIRIGFGSVGHLTPIPGGDGKLSARSSKEEMIH